MSASHFNFIEFIFNYDIGIIFYAHFNVNDYS